MVVPLGMKLRDEAGWEWESSLRVLSGGGEPLAQAAHLLRQRHEFWNGALGRAEHTARDLAGPDLELAARGSEGDVDPALVFHRTDARHQARGLQALEQRGERAGVQAQPLAELGDHQAVALPEHEHGEVLRVRQ